MLLIFTLFLAISFVAFLIYHFKFKHSIEVTKNIPSPPSLPIIGHGYHFIGREPHEFYQIGMNFIRVYGDTVKFWLGPKLLILTSDIKDIEALLSSTRFNEKSSEYQALKPWLREGLLISRGKKWHKRRKIITPAFHFQILEQFVDIFESKSRTLLQNLDKVYRMQNEDGFPLHNWISLCTLDIICETAMGVSVNAQLNSDSEYVRAVKTIMTVLHKRMIDVSYQFNFIYKLTKLAQDEKKALHVLHSFTEKIIRQRRTALLRLQTEENNEIIDDHNIGIRKKTAFLDMLLQSEIDGKPLTDLDIQEEVDTFMFEGHDTSSSAVTFFFYNIAMNPECQQKCFEEIILAVGKDPSKPLTHENLNNLHYMDLCIKESLRLFPPVPAIGREIGEECEINGKIFPAGATVAIPIIVHGRNEALFPEANKFKPERFDVVTSNEKMNPYAYIPFSAGPRNCIGQKFAMLELKTIVANVLRRYEVEFVDDGEEILPIVELILRTKDPLMFKIKPRQFKMGIVKKS